MQMTELYQRQLKDRTVQEAIKTLERRVNQLGVAEPVIAAHGNRGDQILVQLPGVTDVEQAKRVIKTTAQLALKLVEDSAPPAASPSSRASRARSRTTWRWCGSGRAGRASPSSTWCDGRR